MKRTRLIVLVAAVIVLGGLAFAIFRSREPSYQGRTLSAWVEEGVAMSDKSIGQQNRDELNSDTDVAWRSVSRAVKQIGPEGLPFLLKWARAKDSALKQKIIAWSIRHPSFHVRLKSAYYYHAMASLGFRLLGNEAKPAWPTLIQGTYGTDTELRFWALHCLLASKPGKETVMPVLRRLLQDPDLRVRMLTAVEFQKYYPQDADAAGIVNMSPESLSFPTNR